MMPDFATLVLRQERHGVVRLTLNRPHRHNALDGVMIRELAAAAELLAAAPDLRAVILDAAGTSFCAGGDLDWMKQQSSGGRAARTLEATALARMLRLVDELPQLVTALVAGAAYGGGVGLASVCDIVIAAPDVRFQLTETRLGLIPAVIAPFLHRRVGPAALRRFGLHGAAIDAGEARAVGLVSEVVPADQLEAAAQRHVGQVLACAPGAVADAKRLFRDLAAAAAGEAETIAALVRRWENAEAEAGIAAFFSKRPSPWQD